MPTTMATPRTELVKIAREIVANGKGILAADESMGTAGKRLSSIGLENSEENRRRYREVLFKEAKALGQFLGGVILFEETVDQCTADGVPFVKLLGDAGIYCGIKLDKGTVVLSGTEGETTTQGLDGLGDRCKKFYEKGCRFAKWRCVLKISDREPSQLAIEENASVLARYAAVCQENGLVPIVEPEILLDGTYSMERSEQVSRIVLATVYKKLHDHHVYLEGTLLKPSMVLPGQESGKRASPEEVGEVTLRVLQRTVPAAVPGICFLSGGQSEEEATRNLNAINRIAGAVKPWRVTFSYARALQSSALKAWEGKDENVAEASRVLVQRAQANSQASLGKYMMGSEKGEKGGSGQESLFEKNYRY